MIEEEDDARSLRYSAEQSVPKRVAGLSLPVYHKENWWAMRMIRDPAGMSDCLS